MYSKTTIQHILSNGLFHRVEHLRTLCLLLLMVVFGGGNVWGQTTYQYYAIHNKDNGYLKQVNGAVAVDKTFRYENSHDGNGSSIWVLSSDGYLQQEMYYLNVANDQTLYLSTEKVTQWTIDNTTASGKNYLKPSGSSKFLCADSGPQLKDSPSKYLNACEMTIEENGTKWDGPKDVSFTVQSPQLVTYLRTYYVHNINATITKDDAGKTNQKVVDKKDSRCYCSLTYITTSDANKETKWDINETSGVIYSKQASGDYSVTATYSVAPLDPIALSLHPAADKTVTLKLQPSPLAPDAGKNYLLFNTKEANYRFPYDDGSLNENDAVKTNASRSVLTEPETSPNNEISWKIVRDDEGFYSFRNVNSGRWLRFDGGQYVGGSDYGVIEVGAVGDATPAGNEYKFRLYKSGTYKNTNTAPTYCILPYSKQYAVFKSDGVAANASVALSVYTSPKVISLNKANDDSKYCIFAYEAENRIYDFTLSGPSSALVTGDYVFNTTQSYFSKNIKGSPANTRDLEISGSYSDVNFIWEVPGHDGYITVQTPTESSGKGTQVITVNSLPSGTSYGKVRVQAKSGSKSSGWKELEFNLYGEPSYTDITSLSQITSSDGYYRLTADVSDAPGVTEFSGFLDGNMHKISGKSAPLFTTLTGTVKNIVLEDVSISGHDGNTGAITCTANGAARIYNVGILSGSVGGTGNTGGLVGYLDGTARVINCYSYADITGGTTVGGIVGYNNVATTATNLKTMVMNCMFYGNITGGTTKSPVYGGKNINNNQGGLNTFNYYSYEKLTGGVSDDQYNCALAVEDKYLNRFEYYRLLLNSNKKLAAYYATGSAENGDKMAKWVLETADRTIDNPKPYPVLKAQGYYPSIVNPDIEHAPDSASVGRNHGGKLGKTLTVHIGGVGSNAPDGASIRMRGAIQLQRTDKDFDRFNFNYDKVQLPYYNDVGTGNYTGNKVVTGWKITAITAVEGDPYTSANYPTTGITDFPNHNYADRKSSNKDLYSVSKRVFSQGAYFDVPYGVTSITIEPYWGQAAYIADANYDVVYKNDYSGKQNVTQTGTQVGSGTKFNGQTVHSGMTNALNALTEGSTVYDKAVVLVGNLHLDGVPSGGDKAFTMMSVDEDNDHEPDYSLIYHHKSRTAICPIRFDFLNIPGTAQAQKPNGASLICNFTIFKTKGWFEVTNTSSFYSSQLEYENLDGVTKSDAPLILQGGVIDQFVSTQSKTVSGKTIYIHVGGNVWIKEFGLGTHSDGGESTPHVPVSVTGGEFPGFYLTGTYNANAKVRTDNAECYISGGHFGEVAGASLEQIDGNVRWQIYDADIDNFFGGGINDAKPIKGNVTTDIYNSHVTLFCGGPKFGNMQTGKTVTTTAEGCTFEKFFGAGYGGTSLSKKKYYDNTTPAWGTTLQGYYTTDRGKYFDGKTTNSRDGGSGNNQYGMKGLGVATDFDYEFFVWSSGSTGGRFFVKFATFSLAQCNDVSSTLKKCTVETNFYGGGNLGKVVGTATSVLEDCTVNGSVYGAGYSASLPTVEVRDGGFVKNPNYNPKSGMFEPAELSGTTTFTWQNAAVAGVTLANGQSGSDLTNHILYTNTDLTTLGQVKNSNLIIKGATSVTGDVYGGGALASMDAIGQTKVTLLGGTINGDVYGGGQGRLAGIKDEKGIDLPEVKAMVGSTKVNLNGLETGDYVAADHSALVEAYPEEATGEDIQYYTLKSKDSNNKAIKGCVVKGSIFGCNNLNGTPKGSVTVNVYKTEGYDGHQRTGYNAETATAREAALDDIDDTHHSYEVKAVYGGGNLAAYEPDDANNKKTQVNIYGCGDTSIQQVYGGGNAASTPATLVHVYGTYEIEEVFGGGNGKDDISHDGGKTYIKNPGANVGFKDYWDYENEKDKEEYDTKDKRAAASDIIYGTGAANVNIHGGRIHRVYGGSNTKGNVKTVAVTMLEDQEVCDFKVDEAYGGGKSAEMDGASRLEMACIPGLKNAYGGAEAADIASDVTLNITNGNFNRVFGGNNVSGTIHGRITVNIEETGCHLITIGQLYGGGNQAPYTGPEILDDENKGTGVFQGPTVNVKSFTSIGEVYGGGYGKTAIVKGDTYVNINVCDGKSFETPAKQTAEITSANTHTGDQLISFSEFKRTDDGGFVTDHDGNRIVEEKNIHVYLPPYESGIGNIGNVYGGGNAAKVDGSTHVNIGTVDGDITFETPTADAEEDRKHTVKGANIVGNVYGGGNNAEVTGDTHVVIGEKYETPSTPTPDPSPTPEP